MGQGITRQDQLTIAGGSRLLFPQGWDFANDPGRNERARMASMAATEMNAWAVERVIVSLSFWAFFV